MSQVDFWDRDFYDFLSQVSWGGLPGIASKKLSPFGNPSAKLVKRHYPWRVLSKRVRYL
jgi:hypothetical protein